MTEVCRDVIPTYNHIYIYYKSKYITLSKQSPPEHASEGVLMPDDI